jgi:hypothetical protein
MEAQSILRLHFDAVTVKCLFVRRIVATLALVDIKAALMNI